MRKSWWLAGLVLLAEICLFSASYGKYFCGDSLYFFSHSLKSLHDVKVVFTSLDDLSTYRPLPTVLFSFGLSPLFGFDPRPYHLAVLSGHLLTTLVVFLFLRRMVRADWAALVGLFYFGVHATGFYVSYDATFLPDFTSGLLSAAAFAAFAYGRRHLSLAFLALALFCKESAVAIPVGLAAIAWLQSRDEGRDTVSALKQVIPHAVLTGFY